MVRIKTRAAAKRRAAGEPVEVDEASVVKPEDPPEQVEKGIEKLFVFGLVDVTEQYLLKIYREDSQSAEACLELVTLSNKQHDINANNWQFAANGLASADNSAVIIHLRRSRPSPSAGRLAEASI